MKKMRIRIRIRRDVLEEKNKNRLIYFSIIKMSI